MRGGEQRDAKETKSGRREIWRPIEGLAVPGGDGFAGWHVMCFSSGLVKVFAKTMNQEPLFDQGVWITPMILAVCGIAAALCALILT